MSRICWLALTLLKVNSAATKSLEADIHDIKRSTTLFDEASVTDVYEDVRNDATETTWALLGYAGKQVVVEGTGVDYQEFLDNLTDDIRAYGYVRFETGDEMSRQTTFAFITWIGAGVSPLKKAKVSTDKAFIKAVMSDFSKEILADELDELKESRAHSS